MDKYPAPSPMRTRIKVLVADENPGRAKALSDTLRADPSLDYSPFLLA
jgi:response regulator NasT